MDVHRQMTLFETATPPQGTAAVWETLDDQQRTEVMSTLAALIAKAARQLLGLAAIGHSGGSDD